MLHIVHGLTVLLKMSQSHVLIAQLISVGIFVDAECSVCVLTGIAFISLHSCLQVTGTVIVECNGYVYQRRKAHTLFSLYSELPGCEYKHISTVLSPN